MAESLLRRPVATLPSLHFPLLVSVLLTGQVCLMILRGIGLIESGGAALINQPEKRGARWRETGSSFRQYSHKGSKKERMNWEERALSGGGRTLAWVLS